MRDYFKDEAGVAATEFALVAPILILMMVGLLDFGTYVNQQMKLENVSMAAAQYILLGGDEDALQDEILTPANLDLTMDDITVSHIYECEDGAEASEGDDCGEGDYLREYVEVTLSKNYDAFISYAGLLDNMTLRGRVRLQKG